jgi:hypothetical protein
MTAETLGPVHDARNRVGRRLAPTTARGWGRRRAPLVAAGIVAVTSFLRSASASSVSAYEAPPECPGPQVFDEEVDRRGVAGRAPRRVRISITKAATDGYDGQLIFDGRARELHASSCDEVVQALALAVAMAAEDAVEERASPPPAAVDRAPQARAEDATAPRAGSRKRPDAIFGLAFGATNGVGPGVSPELSVFGGLEHDGHSFRLGLSAARSASLATALGTARIERLVLGAEGCPLSVRASVLRVSPCGRIEGGFLRGAGESLENAESSSLPWLAVGVGGRLSLDVTQTLFVEADARAAVPLLRHGFFVRPDDVVYRVPSVTAEVFVAMGYRFSK